MALNYLGQMSATPGGPPLSTAPGAIPAGMQMGADGTLSPQSNYSPQGYGGYGPNPSWEGTPLGHFMDTPPNFVTGGGATRAYDPTVDGYGPNPSWGGSNPNVAGSDLNPFGYTRYPSAGSDPVNPFAGAPSNPSLQDPTIASPPTLANPLAASTAPGAIPAGMQMGADGTLSPQPGYGGGGRFQRLRDAMRAGGYAGGYGRYGNYGGAPTPLGHFFDASNAPSYSGGLFRRN